MVFLNLHIHNTTACCPGPAIIQWSYHYSCWKLFALEIDSFLESVGSGAGENFCALQSCVLLWPLVWILYCNIFFMCHVKWLVMVNEFFFFIILNLAVDCQNVICIVELVNEVLLNDWDKAVYLQPLSSRLYLIIQR